MERSDPPRYLILNSTNRNSLLFTTNIINILIRENDYFSTVCLTDQTEASHDRLKRISRFPQTTTTVELQTFYLE